MKNTKAFQLKYYLSRLFFALVLLFTVLYVIIGRSIAKTDFPEKNGSCNAYSASFEIEGEGAKNHTFPYYSDRNAGDTTVLLADLPGDMEDNMVICLRPDQLDTRVYIDGELRMEYSTESVRIWGKVSPRRYIFMPVEKKDAGKELRIELTTAVNQSGSFNILNYGDKYDVVMNLIRGSMSDIVIAFIMLIVSVLCLVSGIILSIGLKSFFEITYLAAMSILASIWILCNAEASQLYFPNMTMTMTIDYMMLMLLPFPFLFFMNLVQNRKFDMVYKVFEVIAMAESSVCLILFVLKIVDLSQMFLVIAAVFGSSLIMILVTIVLDILKYKNYRYIIVAFGIFAGIFATILQLLLFAFGRYAFGGKAVAIALLIIMATSVIDTFRRVKQMEIDKQMAIAQSKAESSFLANMSHEIRTPINAVLGLNEMVIRETQEEKTLGYAKHIESSGKMLLAIINDILDLSKIRSGKLKIIVDEYSLEDAIRNVCDMIRPKAAEKKLEFSVSVDSKLPNNLIGDEIRIKQIAINILNNAVKYTDAGKVSLKVTGVPIDDETTSLSIAISDTGRGIKEEDQAALFDAFSRVDEKNNKSIEGTGLGLALVKSLVDSMGGTVSVESVYGEGSTFIVEIPQKKKDDVTVAEARKAAAAARREERAREESGQTENAESAPASKKKKDEPLFLAPDAKILVVDDVPLNLMVVTSLLERTQVQVTEAESGVKCLECLAKDHFDVILLDHLMPQMDGVETLTKIKKENLATGTAVVALTANAVSGAREEYLSYGFDDYLTKPVRSEELEATILRYLPKDKVQ